GGVTTRGGPGGGAPRLRGALPIGAPRALRLFDTAKDHHVDDAAAPELRGGGRVTGGRPQRRMGLLPRSGPNVHVAVGEVLAFPAERPLAMRERLQDEVDGFPEAFDDTDGV